MKLEILAIDIALKSLKSQMSAIQITVEIERKIESQIACVNRPLNEFQLTSRQKQKTCSLRPPNELMFVSFCLTGVGSNIAYYKI